MTSCGNGSSTIASGASAGGTSGTTAEFSFFSPVNDGSRDDGETDGAKNGPVYWMTQTKTWGDNNAKINLSYHVPVAGTGAEFTNLMFGTGDYYDIVDISSYSGTVLDLYNAGIAMDLTDYVSKYMPNYSKWMDNHPNSKKLCMDKVNGVDKYLRYYDATDKTSPWGGLCYRRDWIAKYGTNPVSGSADFGKAFTGAYDANKVWSDNVVFPSGNTDPVYLSDWNWMLGVLKTAIQGEGITDGYVMQVPYTGFYGTGDVINAFGIGGGFYLDSNNKTMKYALTSDNFREYLKMMNTWYKAGYVDKKFAERTNDMFYVIDINSVFSGKVGFWYGLQGQLNNALDISDGKENNATNGYTNGICVFGAPEPINDCYGTTAMQNITPFSFYQMAPNNSSFIVTDKAKDKDLSALFTFIDYMYTDDGAMQGEAGLSKEEYDQTKDSYYTLHNMQDGAWYYCDSQGEKWDDATSQGNKMWRMNPKALTDDNVRSALKRGRVGGRVWGTYNNAYVGGTAEVVLKGINNWSKYTSNSNNYMATKNKLSSEDSGKFSHIKTNLDDFVNRNLPGFISGKSDINSDATWKSFVNSLNKYKPEDAVAILQNAFDTL